MFGGEAQCTGARRRGVFGDEAFWQVGELLVSCTSLSRGSLGKPLGSRGEARGKLVWRGEAAVKVSVFV